MLPFNNGVSTSVSREYPSPRKRGSLDWMGRVRGSLTLRLVQELCSESTFEKESNFARTALPEGNWRPCVIIVVSKRPAPVYTLGVGDVLSVSALVKSMLKSERYTSVNL